MAFAPRIPSEGEASFLHCNVELHFVAIYVRATLLALMVLLPLGTACCQSIEKPISQLDPKEVSQYIRVVFQDQKGDYWFGNQRRGVVVTTELYFVSIASEKAWQVELFAVSNKIRRVRYGLQPTEV